MQQVDIRRVSNALLVLEVAVRSISKADLKELMAIKDSGRSVGVEQLPKHVFKTPQDGMVVLNALASFKNAVSNIENYQQKDD